jgi:hypothetical protein
MIFSLISQADDRTEVGGPASRIAAEKETDSGGVLHADNPARHRRAPIVFRTPVSRVLSVTDLSMLFITPP